MRISQIVIVVLVVLVGVVLVASCDSVPAGHVGVVTTFGKISPNVLQPGAHLVNPLSKVTPISVQILRDQRKHEAASRDLQDVIVMLGINYHLRPEAVRTTFETIGVRWAEVIIPNAESETLKAVVAKYPVAEVLAQRQEIKAVVEQELRVWLAKYGIALDEVSIADIAFSAEYADAIEAKQVEEQRALQKSYELQGAQKQAEIAKAKAQGEASAAIAKAEGDAEAITLLASAQAAANERIADSLAGPQGERVLLSHQIEKWNGTMPSTLLAPGTPFLFSTK